MCQKSGRHIFELRLDHVWYVSDINRIFMLFSYRQITCTHGCGFILSWTVDESLSNYTQVAIFKCNDARVLFDRLSPLAGQKANSSS